MCEMCDMMMILGQFENSDSTLEFRTSSTNTVSSHFNVVATQNMTTFSMHVLQKYQCVFRSGVCIFLFFFHVFWDKFYCYDYCSCIVHEQQPQSLTCETIFSQSVHIVYCLRTHKFYFSATFSLKMGPTVLFTHLKIILL